MVDFDALIRGGIVDARERAPLIEYLDRLGFTSGQMVEAQRRGRLFGLAGDALHSSGPAVHSLASAAEALGLTLADVERAWTALGLSTGGPDEVVLSQADVDGLALWADMRAALGEEAATGLLRVVGSAMARLSEAVAAMIRHANPGIQIEQSHDELVTARTYRDAATFIPRLGALFDAVHRHHLQHTRRYLELVARENSATVDCGVGFADLSGFTALTQSLGTLELSSLLGEFSAAAADVIHGAGGRLVKFIGDEVMWVAPDARQLTRIAVDLVGHRRAAEAGLPIRAGCDFGTVLATAGDYFGTPVNRAARLVAAAAPGQILVTATVHELAPDLPADAPTELTLKGFDQPVTAYALI